MSEQESELEPSPVKDADPEPESIVPEDCHVELPFPMLIANDGPILYCAKVIRNKAVAVVALDARSGATIAEMAGALTAAPDGTEISDHWKNIISYLAANLKAALKKKAQLAAPAIVKPRESGLVTVGAL